MNNLTNALSETSSKARSAEILTKQCIGIRLRLHELRIPVHLSARSAWCDRDAECASHFGMSVQVVPEYARERNAGWMQRYHWLLKGPWWPRQSSRSATWGGGASSAPMGARAGRLTPLIRGTKKRLRRRSTTSSHGRVTRCT